MRIILMEENPAPVKINKTPSYDKTNNNSPRPTGAQSSDF